MEKNYKKNMRRLKCSLLGVFLSALLCVSLVRAESVQRGALVAERLDNYLKKIELAYQVSFVYDASQINKSMSINVPSKLSSINSDLEPLKENGINYNIVGKQVILKKIMEPAVRRDVSVKGRVISIKDKDPLPGVSVREKGVSNGVSTNGEGHYQIKVKDGATLVFSAIGYRSKEVAVAGRTTIDVSLDDDVSQLKEVTISTGYQELNKKLFTGSATKIKAVDAQRNGIQDVSRMLEGQVAGVSVQNVSGTFGAAPKIRIRGASSLNGDNKPLWVVDGIMLEDLVNISNEQLSSGDASTLIGSSVAGLNPDDIESFEILRDAAATAMYGARAMNGVVVVTTKKGRNTEGKPQVSYSGNFTTYLKPSYNQFDIMNSADQMQVYLDMENKGWLRHSDVSRAANGGVYRKMYDQMYDYDPVADKFTLKNDAPSRLQFLNRYANANTDWFDVLFRNSLMQDHSLSITSGTEKAKIYASTSFLHDSGWTVGDGVKRFTGNIRGTFDLSDRLQVESGYDVNHRNCRIVVHQYRAGMK
jgi:TonB-dependent SusC/RagA subfamily outer membrane receptor